MIRNNTSFSVVNINLQIHVFFLKSLNLGFLKQLLMLTEQVAGF